MPSGSSHAIRGEVTDWVVNLMVQNGFMLPQIGGIVVVDDALDQDRLASALSLLVAVEPVLGCRFVATGGRPQWEPLDPIEARDLLSIRRSVLPFRDALSWLAEPLDPSADPQMQAALFRKDDGDALALKFSHVAVDGQCVKEAMYRVAEWYTRLGIDPYFSVMGVTPDRPRAIARVSGGAATWQRVSALKPEASAPRTTWGMPGLASEEGRPTYLRRTVARETFMGAREWARVRGATVDELLLAAYCVTLRAQLDPQPGPGAPVRFSCDYRPSLPADCEPAFGNFSGTRYLDSCLCGESLEGSLRAVVQQEASWNARGAAMNAALTLRLAEMIPYGLFAWGSRRSAFTGGTGYPTLTNVGEIDDARLFFDGALPSQAVTVGPIAHPPGFVLGASIYRDRLTIAAGIDTRSTERQRAEAIIDGVVTRLEVASAS